MSSLVAGDGRAGVALASEGGEAQAARGARLVISLSRLCTCWLRWLAARHRARADASMRASSRLRRLGEAVCAWRRACTACATIRLLDARAAHHRLRSVCTRWRVRCDGGIARGGQVRVIGRRGLTLMVEPVAPLAASS
jgi:hypothetical protein